MFERVVLLARIAVGSIHLVAAIAGRRLVAATLLAMFVAAMASALARVVREHHDRRRAVEVVRPVLA